MRSSPLISQLTHHAYCFVGPSSLKDGIIYELVTVHKIPTEDNPDFFHRSYESFLIDDAREIHMFHGSKPVHPSGRKIIILATDTVTIEAQNALLKLLEEPAEYAHFFIIVPSRHILLPTIQSRLCFIDTSTLNIAEDEHTNDIEKVSASFLTAPLSKRFEIAKQIADDVSESKKPRRYVIRLIDVLERHIRNTRSLKDARSSLEAIAYVRTYLYDRAPSIKILLEYVAMNILSCIFLLHYIHIT